MASQLHFVLIPFLCPGHIIPIVDIARILAQSNAIVTVITTPVNAARSLASIGRSIESGLPIQARILQFPTTEVGLPQGCESIDLVPSKDLYRNFIKACDMFQEPVEKLIEEFQPSPSCIIADKHFPWTANLALKFGIPRILFDGTSCFYLLCLHNLLASKVHETVSETEPFVVPRLPHHVELTKAQLPSTLNSTSSSYFHEFRQRVIAAEENPYGVLINSFEELEQDYVKEYKKAKGGNRVWCVGPVSLSNTEDLDKAQRGNKSATDEIQCLKWLDSQSSGSVVYACLGSLNQVMPAQLIELGLALEASNRPFIWVIRGVYEKEEMEELLVENGFEERLKGRGLLIRGWSPQVLILSHPAIGGFITHCGWNSTLEAISSGVPMITWPLFADQFINEKLVVQVLKIGVKAGSEVAVHLHEEEKFRVMVTREKIGDAIDRLMGEGKESEERRERARKLGEMAKKAVEEGGSSCLNIRLLIEDIKQLSRDEHNKKISP